MYTVLKRTLVTALALAACALTAARAQTDPKLPGKLGKAAEDAGLDWRAIARARSAEAPPASRPTRAVPEDLRAVAGPAPALPAPAQPEDEEVGRRAHAAAKQTASQLLELDGRQEAYRLGLYDGLHAALDDPRLGRRELESGLAHGRRSPEARLRGSDIGARAAEETAERVAGENVSAQFHDLSVEPFPRPYAEAPPFGAALRESAPPALDEIIHNYPLHGFLRRGSPEPLPDPWQLYRQRSHRDLFVPRWRNAHEAYEHWVRSHPGDRQPYFEQMFLSTYPRALATIAPHVVDEAFSRGFHDGWDYGAFVHGRQSYLGGYYQGWYEALRRSAEEAYRYGFRESYAARYSQYFHDWSTSPRPEILAVRMSDGNDDGVFEPGETLDVEYELANYGGAPGDFVVRLASQVLRQGASEPVELPRRSIRSGWRPAAR